MTAPTHIAFGLLSAAGTFSLLATSLHKDLPAVGCAMLGSLLPDIDTPGSAIGRTLPFVSAPVERRWGHRTITHSFLALLCLGVLASPLLAYRWTCLPSLLVGFTSHLIADCATKSGTPLFYPNPTICVFPANSRYRIHTGSVFGEKALLIVLVLFLVLFMPVLRIGGIWRASRYLIATPRAAYADYRQAGSEAILFYRGRWRDSRVPVEAEAAILDGTPEWFLVASGGRTLIVGDDGDIIPDKLRVRTTRRPIRLESLSVHRKTFVEVLKLIPGNSVVSGRLGGSVSFDPGPLNRLTRSRHISIRQAGSALILDFAPRSLMGSLAPRRRMSHQRLSELRGQIGGLSAGLRSMQLKQPPAHYLKLREAREELAACREALARLSDPNVRFTGVLSIRILGGER